MPAISSQDDVVHLLRAREWQETVGQSGMTPTAFSFLIPVFVVAIVAPFLCIFCIRKRRRTTTPVTTRVTPKVKKPALRRAEAREKLKEITQVSSEVSNATQGEQETTEVESHSVMERECAICLSTLHAPSPPEPAKLSPTSSISDAAADLPSSTPSTTDQPQPADTPTTAAVSTQPDTETILKLSVCGHEFHSECLVSWFILRKTSCPICRSMYMSTEDMEKYDQEEQIALGGTPTPTTTNTVDPEAQTATSSQVRPPIAMRNWRYFVLGRDAYRRQQERQQAEQTGVELRDQSAAATAAPAAPTAGGQTEQQAATSDQGQPAQTSRWRRFFSRT